MAECLSIFKKMFPHGQFITEEIPILLKLPYYAYMHISMY